MNGEPRSALGDQVTFTELGEQRLFSLVNRRTRIIFRLFAVPNEVDGVHVEGDAQAASSMSTERLLHHVEHASKEEQRSHLALNGGLNDYSQFRAPACEGFRAPA